MKIKNPFPFYPQFDMMDCGPACLRMVARWHGKHYTLQTLRRK
ncbi:MAG TPA: cysteine peptidase family C39 domain-containing protein, partial [Alloprevotella sp.]|nr:cysteine peptidase family C39 domain-containing protein [Alloprevotella sp.]